MQRTNLAKRLPLTRAVTAPWTRAQARKRPVIDWREADDMLPTAAFSKSRGETDTDVDRDPGTSLDSLPRLTVAAKLSARARGGGDGPPRARCAPAKPPPRMLEQTGRIARIRRRLAGLSPLRRAPAAGGPVPAWLLGVAGLSASLALVLLLSQLSGGAAVAAPVRPAPAPIGALLISAEPRAATVMIDGAERCPVTPCYLGGLPLDRQLLVAVRAPGHEVWWQRVVLSGAERTLALAPRLRSIPPAGSSTVARPLVR